MAIEKKLYTVEEFEKFADSRENADRRFELINGEIVEKSPLKNMGLSLATFSHLFGISIESISLVTSR